jgi:predicted AlkP superfamily pyrophosphatase or phosphodiesterase
MPHSPRDASLLSPTNYDDDASSIHSERSDQDTDSEDDEVLMGARTSADVREHDRSVLLEEEERDRLLEESRRRGRRGSALLVAPLKKLFSKSTTDLSLGLGNGSGDLLNEEKGGGKREKRRRRRERRRERKERLMSEAEQGEDGHLMYEMEEGGMKEGSSTGSSSEAEGSDELDRRGLKGLHDEKAARRRRWRRWCFIHLLIAVGFSILVLLSWKLSLNRKKATLERQQKIMSNGTALFAPTTILISLDGFRADFLNRGITPNLNAFIAEGISPAYMMPSFPSVTFPNHHTIATGLYPESHGVVGNTFWDEELQEEFYYTNPNAMQPKWWGGEPIWVTAESQGLRSAIHMWPGSEAHIGGLEPAFIDNYNGKELLPNKVTRILEWLDRPGLENKLAEVVDMRPQLIAAYVPNVDSDGHKYGPNSTEIRTTIAGVDDMLNGLLKGLDERNLTYIVNVVVVSDHGMATTDTSRMIQLEDILDTGLIEHMDGWPLYGLRPKNPADLQFLYDKLAAEAAVSPGFEVYLRDENMPERYHFSKNERIAPLWMIPKAGWAIVTKDEFDVADAKAKGIVYHPRGLHGYDHEHPLMRAIFVARGPAFPHSPNSRVEPFRKSGYQLHAALSNN